MLARAAPPRGESAAAGGGSPAAREGPSVEELTLPQDALGSASDADLFRFFFAHQTARIELITFFDDAFEHLVTDGRADDYPGLVQRFKSKFAVIDQNIERIAAKLGGLGPVIPNLMRAVLTEEKARLDLKCEEQVLRQHLSTTNLEDDARPALKQKVASVTASLSAKAAKVEESLEELRAEQADLE